MPHSSVQPSALQYRQRSPNPYFGMKEITRDGYKIVRQQTVQTWLA